MVNRNYRPPRISNGDLRTWIVFLDSKPKEDMMPGTKTYEKVYEAWAKIDTVWARDLELAKSTGTLSDLTITIRDPSKIFTPTNKHIIEIEDPLYADKKFNVKEVQPDMQRRDFVRIVAEVSAWG